MPLTQAINAQLAALRAFLDAPEAVLFELRVPAEHEQIAVRLLGAFDDGTGDAFVPIDAALPDRGALCVALEAGLLAAANEARAAAAADGIELGLPAAPPDPTQLAERVPEHRVAEYAERIARALAPFIKRLVVVVRAAGASDPAELGAAMARVGAATASGRVKYVLISHRERPVLLGAPPLSRPRVAALPDEAVGSDDPVLRQFLASPLARVLLADAPGEAGRAALRARLLKRVAGSARVLVAPVDGLRFFSAMHFHAEVARAVARRCLAHAQARGGDVERALAWVARADEPVGYEEAELYAAQALEQLVDEVLPAGTTLVVALTPALDDARIPEGERAGFRASIARLARAALGPRVKYVVGAPGLAALLDPPGQAVRTHELLLDAATIERGLEARLREPDLPPLERLRFTSALASFAMGRGDPERGMRLSVEACGLADATGDPREVAMACYGLGGALYRCAALDRAAVAYGQCVELAVDHDQPVLAAHGLLGIAHCHLVGRQLPLAIQCYGHARTYFARLGIPLAESYALGWLGEAELRAGRTPDALRSLRAALECCDRAERAVPGASGAREMRIEVLQRLAQACASAGMRDEAARLVSQARAAAGGEPPPRPSSEP